VSRRLGALEEQCAGLAGTQPAIQNSGNQLLMELERLIRRVEDCREDNKAI
jgi:hypothetical protein